MSRDHKGNYPDNVHPGRGGKITSGGELSVCSVPDPWKEALHSWRKYSLAFKLNETRKRKICPMLHHGVGGISKEWKFSAFLQSSQNNECQPSGQEGSCLFLEKVWGSSSTEQQEMSLLPHADLLIAVLFPLQRFGGLLAGHVGVGREQ